MKRVALLALVLSASTSCAAFKSAEKDPAGALTDVKGYIAKGDADAHKLCDALPAIEALGVVPKAVTKDAEIACLDLAKAETLKAIETAP